jgi:adenylosuccinate synthase
MPATCVIDAYWGDSGKGKIVDYLSSTGKYQHVVRFSGGGNAGHTLIRDGEKYVCNLVPCGLLNESVRLYIAAGCVVDIESLTAEVAELQTRLGRNLKLFLSEKAHVITELDKKLDAARDATAGIGTTKKGIGPAYAAKANRNGLRVCQLQNLSSEKIFEKLCDHDGANLLTKEQCLELSNKLIQSYNRLTKELGVVVSDVEEQIRFLLRQGVDVLFEGAQGTFLDVSHGDYPYCTSSHTTAAAAATYCGFPANEIQKVIMVTKPYITRVGNGPLDYELLDEDAKHIRELGNEYGAVTGRPRRIAWLDLDKLRLACEINGATDIALTKADLISKISDIKVVEDGVVTAADGLHMKVFADFIERNTGVDVTIFGTGPESNAVIVREFEEV